MKKGYINLIKNLQTKQGIKILVSSLLLFPLIKLIVLYYSNPSRMAYLNPLI